MTLLKNWLQDVLPWFTGNAAQFEIVVFSILFVCSLQYARGGLTFALIVVPPAAAGDVSSRRKRRRRCRAENCRRAEPRS